jgi:Icc-related predicted phosphoesterase
MSSAQVDVGMLRICWGVRRGKRLVCKEPVTDEETIREVEGLISELRRRVERHKGKLENAAFIDELIDLLERWLEEHKSDEGKKVRKARKIVKRMIELLRRLRRRWVEEYWKQLLELIELLERNATDIIVTRGNSDNKSLIAHIYSKDVAINISKITKSEGVTISLTLSKLEGDYVKVANTFSDEELLKVIQHGWEMTDGFVEHKYPAMCTNQTWQAVLWSLTYPGEVRMRIYGIGINEDNVSIRWHLTAKDHVAKPKRGVAKEVERLGTERLKAFLAPAIWSDGTVYITGIEYMALIIGLSKYDLWFNIIERLINELGFTVQPRNYSVEVVVRSSKAVRLARDWLSVPDIKELIELGASLPGGEKLRRIIELASKDVKERGISSIAIPGTDISMSIHIDSNCHVELRAWRRDENETLRLVEELNKVGLHPSIYVERGYYVVSINHTNIRDSPLKLVVCQKLGKWLEGEKDERRKKRIARAMQNLKCFDHA